MTRPRSLRWLSRFFIIVPSLFMLGLLSLPLMGLLTASTPRTLLAGLQHPLFLSALWLSTYTTCLSLLLIVLTGTPLAWWLAHRQNKLSRFLERLLELPLFLPPAVIGIALLQSFGSQGLLGPWLAKLGLRIPFSTLAVILAQTVVAAPFYLQSAIAAFRDIDQDLWLVARTLGQSTAGAFFRIALPLTMPGLLGGAALAWGRALGEFGATLLFAGNLTGHTQTMPLAIYTALESDIRIAIALSLCLAGLGCFLLFGLRQSSVLSIKSAPKAQEKRS